MDEVVEHNEPLFRPTKRRKIVRKKQAEDSADESTATPTHDLAQVTDNGNNSIGQPLAHDTDTAQESADNVPRARQRRLVGTKRGGIGFSSTGTPSISINKHDSDESQALVPTHDASEVASTRFVVPTGQVVTSDDKHMMAYIDSKMAKIRSTNFKSPSNPAGDLTDTTIPVSDQPRSVAGQLTVATSQQRDASKDPEPSTHKDQAQAEAEAQLQAHRSALQRPPRLGRDGKPLRPRKDRNRRTSFDIARDAMVEQVLRESRLDIYDDSAAKLASTSIGAGLDEDADERMAAEFRRDFLAAQEDRTIRKPPPPPGAKGDPAKGPKLGGSRSQRAAMRALEEQAAAKGKK